MTSILSESFLVTEADLPKTAIALLVEKTGLSNSKIKDAMNKGAAWLAYGKQGKKIKDKRLRRAKYELQAGQTLSFYYDAKILAEITDPAVLMKDYKQYSIWIKPAGMLSQGTHFGDHTSLLRFVEKHFPNRENYLIHRLDREASGLMLIAHTKKAAALFSTAFSSRNVEKLYDITVRGCLTDDSDALQQLDKNDSSQYIIHKKLDGKVASTFFTVEKVDLEENTSRVRVQLVTGRKHQIRRHFSSLGFPVIGDPRYGHNNKSDCGLQLTAISLRFTCPVTKEERCITLAD